MWFKKKSQISGYNANTAYDGTDWRITGDHNNWSISHTLPSAADANKYFYLPALGYYDYYNSGLLRDVGDMGWYWSSSAYPWSSYNAHYLELSSSNVRVTSFNRFHGYRVGGFE